MKSFMKFVVTLIVLAIIAFVVGFLVMNSNNIKTDNIKNSGEILNSGENLEEEIQKKTLSKEEIISEINKQVTAINYNGLISEFDYRIKEDEATDAIKEFMNYFKVNDMLVKVKVKKGCVELIPYSDFIENMVYYFDGAGNLILFESVSTTVGGSCKYYFNNGELIDVLVAYGEKIEVTPENASDILNRAKNIYEKYGELFNNETKDKKGYLNTSSLSGEEKMLEIIIESGD